MTELTFQQELHPFTGAPVGEGVGYAPSLLIYLEAVKRLGWQVLRRVQTA